MKEMTVQLIKGINADRVIFVIGKEYVEEHMLYYLNKKVYTDEGDLLADRINTLVNTYEVDKVSPIAGRNIFMGKEITIEQTEKFLKEM